MKEIYYYYRDVNNRPVVTVCLIGGRIFTDIARGISICSPKDIPCKKTGRFYARERAIRAFIDRFSFDPIVGKDELEVIGNASKVDNFWNNHYKGQCPVGLNCFEIKLIQAAKDI